jgi:surface polysaccharide O-acyltransferase-like enzyme
MPTTPAGFAFTSYLRIVAISAVVLIHVLAAIAGNDEIRYSRTWWVGTVLDIGVAWAVPAFVMVSGALLLAPSRESIGDFYRRRVARIGIPLVAAHLGYLVLRATLLDQDLDPGQVTVEILQARVFTHLYFFWIIIGLYAVTPLLRAFVERHGERAVRVAAICGIGWMLAVTVGGGMLRLLGVPSTPWQPAALTLFIPYIGYFLLGYAVRDVVLGRRGTTIAAMGIVVGSGLAIAAYAFAIEPPWLDVLLGGNYLGFPVALATASVYLLGRSALDHLGVLADEERSARARRVADLSFGVFIVHFAVLVGVRLWVPALSFGETRDSVPLALVQWAIVTMLSFAIAAILARIPGVRRLIGLSGGR